MTAAAADFTGDNWLDLYVASDSTAAILYRNNRDGTFTDIALESGAAYNEQGNAQAGMGLAIGDFNSDARLDILKTHFADDIPALYRGLGDGLFEDVRHAGAPQRAEPVRRVGRRDADIDNDGRPDIFYVTGNVYPEVERVLPQYPHRGPRIVFQNADGERFVDVSAMSGQVSRRPRSSRGAAFGDIDNDGDIDVLIMNMNEPPSLLRNGYTRREWLDRGAAPGRADATRTVSARVVLVTDGWTDAGAGGAQPGRATTRTTTCGFISGSGRRAVAERIEVRWPSGVVDTMKDVRRAGTSARFARGRRRRAESRTYEDVWRSRPRVQVRRAPIFAAARVARFAAPPAPLGASARAPLAGARGCSAARAPSRVRPGMAAG